MSYFSLKNQACRITKESSFYATALFSSRKSYMPFEVVAVEVVRV
jgi:hypothetical protein